MLFHIILTEIWLLFLATCLDFRINALNGLLFVFSTVFIGDCRKHKRFFEHSEVNVHRNFVQIKQWCAWHTIQAASGTKSGDIDVIYFAKADETRSVLV